MLANSSVFIAAGLNGPRCISLSGGRALARLSTGSRLDGRPAGCMPAAEAIDAGASLLLRELRSLTGLLASAE